MAHYTKKQNTPQGVCFWGDGESLLSDIKTQKQNGWLASSVLLCSLAEREGFEPPEPRSSTVFKTAAIDHSATSPKDKSIAYFCNHQIFLQKILKIFILHITTTCASAYYKKHSVSVIFEEIALCHYIFAKIALCDASQKPITSLGNWYLLDFGWQLF